MGFAMKDGVIHAVLVERGAKIVAGTPLLEVRLDLTSSAPQNCAPVTFFRIVSRESGWMRTSLPVPGTVVAVDAELAIVSHGENDPIDDVTRSLRITASAVTEL